MALSLVASTSLALRPDSQHALAHRPQIAPATKESETAQYKNVLAVAVSQEQRLSRNGAVRRGAGYDMSDPFMVATSEMDFTGKPCKALEFAKLEVPGLPCQVIGDTTVVAAFLRVIKDKDNKPKKPQECLMRFPDGQEKSVPRNCLLPLPTRPPRQCDWAMAIDLKGERERYNGFRCICGLAAPQEPPAFWVMFELSAGGSRAPLMELLPLTNLVALPSMPYGGPETEWEARLRALPDIGKLWDDPGEPLLALKDEEENDGDKSEALTEEEDEALEVGDVVTLGRDNSLGILKKLDEKLAQVHVLPRSTSDPGMQLETHERRMLTKSSQEEAEQNAVCTICEKAEPEAELLICENFYKSCASTIHLRCLKPPWGPLKEVPPGDWFCPICIPKEQRRAAKAKAAPKDKPKAQKTKAKAKPKVKATAKASISKRKA